MFSRSASRRRGSSRPRAAAAALARATLCYALAVLVGIAFVLSPLIAGMLARPQTAAAAASAGEAPADGGSDSGGGSYALHGVSKITVAAYPLVDGTDGWQVRKRGGGSAATKSIDERGGMLRLAVSAVWDDGVTTHEYDTGDEGGWSSRPGFTEGFTYKSSDADTIAVSSIGVATALKDGEATIEVTPKNPRYEDKTAKITLTARNQEGGLRVEKIAIVDENDRPYGDDPVKFSKLYQTRKLYAKVTYTNEDAKDAEKEARAQLEDDLLALKKKYDALSDERGEKAHDDALSAEKKAGASDDEAEKRAKAAETDERKAVDDEYAAERAKLRAASAKRTEGLREKVVYSNAPGAPSDEKPNDYEKQRYYASVSAAFANIVWHVGDTQYVTIASHDGVATLKAVANSLTRVYATITGGDAGKDVGFGAGVVYDSVSVNVADRERARSDGQVPSDDLNVKVVYERSADQVVKQAHYTLDEFKALGEITRTYTLTRSGGRYVTDRARGVPIATILLKLGISADDISYFTLAANDGANPGRLSAQFLLKTTRYYLPNYDIGGSWQEKEQVPTMIAYEDSWNSDTTVTGEMNSGTRFRLVFGAATSADQSTDKSIKFVNTVTIVMKGAAPSTNGDDPNQTRNTDSGDSGSGTGENGNGAGAGARGAAGVSGTGSGSSRSAAANGGSGAQSAVGPAAVTNATRAEDANGDAGAKRSSSVGEKSDKDRSAAWRVFEMMNKSASDLAQRYEDNPLLPYLFPSIGILILAAATVRFARFRWQLR